MPDQYGNPTPSASGLSDNVAGGIAYITIIPAIIFLLLEPYKFRSYVRFHCFQCLGIAIVGVAIRVLGLVPGLHLICAILLAILYLAAFVAFIMAFLGKKLMIPGIGHIAERYATTGV